MIVGFTGTQIGMCAAQKKALIEYLQGLDAVTLHHGDCIGADKEADDICKALGNIDTIVHPPENESKRAFCKGYSRIAVPRPYLERNRHIVNCCEVLIVAPKTNEEETRSGTWSTYRYAKRENKGILMLERSEDE